MLDDMRRAARERRLEKAALRPRQVGVREATITGRTPGKPNLQNIPLRTKVVDRVSAGLSYVTAVRVEYVGLNEKNKSGVSSKFWEAWVSGDTYYRSWGRIGSKGCTPVTEPCGQAVAITRLQQHLKTKLRGGYKLVHQEGI